MNREHAQRVVEHLEGQAKKPTIKSDFALLDVKRGRGALFKAVGYTGRRDTSPIPIVITGEIVGAWGEDDGTSREFEVRVISVVTP